tara:strand:- start:763 stop:1590 length:828 start_codon:yes stop_codon:yes gene_type:complete
MPDFKRLFPFNLKRFSFFLLFTFVLPGVSQGLEQNILLNKTAQLTKAEQSSHPTFNIMTEEYPPYNFKENGKITGVATEVVQELLKRVGHPDNIKLHSWSLGYKLIQEKEGHILFSTTRTKVREKLFKWVGPLLPQKLVFFARKGSNYSFSTLTEAKKVRRIGVYRDDVGDLLLKEKGFKNLDRVLDNKLNPKKLVAKRINLWLVGELVGIHLAGKAGLAGKIEKVFDVLTRPLYIAFSKNTPDSVIEEWQKNLDEMKAGGTYKRILEKWDVQDL